MMTNIQERELLEDYLRDMSDPTWVDRAWIRLDVDPEHDFCIDDVLHLFFDDTHFATRPEDHLGDSLFNQTEVEGVRRIVTSLNVLFEAHAHRDMSDADYVSSAQWPDVQKAAKALYSLLLANNAKMAAG